MIDKENEAFLHLNIKGLMQDTVLTMNRRMHDWRQQTEFADLREGDIRIFAQLRGRQFTLSELARHLGITRQAVHLSMKRLEQAAMVVLRDSTRDKKQKVIHMTEKGQRFRQQVATHLQRQELHISQLLGQQDFNELRRILAKLHSLEE